MTVKGGWSEGVNQRRRKRKDTEGEGRGPKCISCVYVQKQHNDTHQTLYKRREEEERGIRIFL
jgi:hypothetical protein